MIYLEWKRRRFFLILSAIAKVFAEFSTTSTTGKKSACQDLSDKLKILITNKLCNPCDKPFTSEDKVEAHKNSDHDDNFEAGKVNPKAEEKKMGVIVINPSIPSRGRLL